MMKLTEEQKVLLSCYEGHKNKVIADIQMGIDELKSTGEKPELLELMEGLVQELNKCSNRDYFQVRNDILLDSEEEDTKYSQ